MPQSNGKFDLSQIRTEIQQIIINGIGNDDLRSIPDDIPILDLGISSLALVEGMRSRGRALPQLVPAGTEERAGR